MKKSYREDLEEIERVRPRILTFAMVPKKGKGVSESAGINRLGIVNERVMQRKPSQ